LDGQDAERRAGRQDRPEVSRASGSEVAVAEGGEAGVCRLQLPALTLEDGHGAAQAGHVLVVAAQVGFESRS